VPIWPPALGAGGAAVLLEEVLEAWLRWQLHEYQTVPGLLESVFVDGQHLGTPTFLAAGHLVDASKRWIPHVHAGGTLVLGETPWPIVDNGVQDLTIDGDPTPLWQVPPRPYTILAPTTAKLRAWLAKNPLPIVVSVFAEIPTQTPCITLRLEQDVQGETYLGEVGSPRTITVAGLEIQTNISRLTGRYLFGIWDLNRDATLWLYSLLMNMVLGSQQLFASWGLADATVHGLDVDPVLGFVPQYPGTRHLALSVSRLEQAVNLAQLEAIDRTRIRAFLTYAPLWDAPRA
jgi:hypothetical protein